MYIGPATHSLCMELLLKYPYRRFLHISAIAEEPSQLFRPTVLARGAFLFLSALIVLLNSLHCVPFFTDRIAVILARHQIVPFDVHFHYIDKCSYLHCVIARLGDETERK